MRWTELPEFDAPPPGWGSSPLQKEANFVFGQSPDSEHYNEQGEGLPFLQGNADFAETFPQTAVYTRQASKKCEPKDTLISVRAPVGELCRADQQYALGRGVAALRPLRMDSDFFFHGMNRWRRPLQRAAQGSTFDAVTGRHFSQLQCLVPPSDEQTRIAETLKAADDHIRALEEQVRKAGRVKKALLQSVFVEGIPGRNGTHQVFHWGAAPAGWVETSIRALLTDPVGNGTSPDSARQEPPGFPTLNVSSIRNGRCDQSKISYIELPEQAAADFGVRQGDFFVLRGNGNRDFVAIGGLLVEEPQTGLVFSDLLIRLRFDHSKSRPDFMKYLWQSPPFLRRLQSYAVTGSGLWKIGQRSISRMKLAVPADTGEQQDITAVFDAQEKLLLALGDQLTAARRVKQSLLQNLLTGKIRLKP